MWALPAVFVAVALVWPVQVYVDERWGQPYPGLFQPTFSDVPDHDRTVRYRAVALKADGRTIDQEVLFPGLNPGRRKRLLEQMFPPQGGPAEVDIDTRRRLRSRIADALGSEPDILTATWQRRRFDLDSRRVEVVRELSEYRVDLRGDR